ncbi:DUF3923 family protein [Bacillus nitroreducens]
MKTLWFFWWVANLFWAVVFVIGTAFVWLREVDGTGAVQTPELKFIAFIVLLIAFIIPASIQGVWLMVNLKMSRNKKAKIQQV